MRHVLSIVLPVILVSLTVIIIIAVCIITFCWKNHHKKNTTLNYDAVCNEYELTTQVNVFNFNIIIILDHHCKINIHLYNVTA